MLMANKSYLKIALIQASLVHVEREANVDKLLNLNRLAARHGAQIILNTEMGLSGYAFPSREQTDLCALPRTSRVIKSFASLARGAGVWLSLGFAEREPRTGILYSSAVMFNPQGRQAALRRKTTAEPRWACPGLASQRGTCDTPWGRVGLLICSETYFGMLPRVHALNGVDLLLCPVNWPMGELNPVEVWRVRAWEDGIYLAACKRAGQDETLSFENAPCRLFDPQGNELPLARVEPEILMAELPLSRGKFRTQRDQRLAGRRPENYLTAYAALRQAQADMGAYYDLPQPGKLHVHCLPQAGGYSLEQLDQALAQNKKRGRNLFVLPAISSQIASQEQLHEPARRLKAAIFTSLAWPGRGLQIVFCDTGSDLKEYSQDTPYHVVDWGPARLSLALAEDLCQPELALTLAKLGCDLASGTGDHVWQGPTEGPAIKCLEKTGLACALPNLGLICLPPKGHHRWQEALSAERESCAMNVDTKPRRKNFSWTWLTARVFFSKPKPPEASMKSLIRQNPDSRRLHRKPGYPAPASLILNDPWGLRLVSAQSCQ